MDGFRWILGLVGLLLVVGVLIYSRRTSDVDADMPFDADDYGEDSLDDIFFDKPEQIDDTPEIEVENSVEDINLGPNFDDASAFNDIPPEIEAELAVEDLPEVITPETWSDEAGEEHQHETVRAHGTEAERVAAEIPAQAEDIPNWLVNDDKPPTAPADDEVTVTFETTDEPVLKEYRFDAEDEATFQLDDSSPPEDEALSVEAESASSEIPVETITVAEPMLELEATAELEPEPELEAVPQQPVAPKPESFVVEEITPAAQETVKVQEEGAEKIEPQAGAKSASIPTPSSMAQATAPVPQTGKGVTGKVDDVLVLYLISNDEKGMAGLRIQAQTKALGFVYSELGVFQYRLHGRLLFSLMNALAPGRIDRDNLETMRTRALTVFMQLPVEEEPYYALDKMVEMTHNLARRLNAVALDGERRPLTMTSVEKMRETINKHVNTHTS